MKAKCMISCGLGILGAGVCLSAQPPTMGCAWYPEAWPKERRATDLDLMQKAGIDSVRICEFNWANFEPREGAFDFADFKSVLDELAKRKMTALLCTATAAPPRWFFEKYPEAWKVTDAGGKRMPIEHRRQYCANNPDFRRRARALTEAQVAAFAGHPAIRAWQLDNELSSDAEGGHCTCRHCTVAFRAWLKRKYGTLENLNRAWNGAFWSNAVQDWDQITPPFMTMIPVFRFEYTRFQSDSFQAFAEEQAAIIRAKDTRPICYNSWMSWQGDFDLAKFTKKMDFVACDTYLGQDFMQIYRAAWDLYRGLKRRPFTVAETGPFSSITARDNATDFLRPAYWEMFAHGADAVYWFRWRRSVMGEEACRSIVQHDGRPGRPYDVISNVRRELLDVVKRTGDLPLPENKIALIFNSWDVQLGRSEDRNIPPYGATMRHYAAIRSTGLGVDVVPIAPEADLSKYALVVIPRCEYLPDDFVRKLHDYIRQGGVIHAGARLNVRGDSSAYRTEPAPHGLTDIFGLSIREFCHVCARNGESFATYKPARDVPGGTFKGTVAGGTATFDREMEDVTLEGARAVEKFPGGLYKGAPLYTKNNYCTGTAFYQAASVDFETEKRLLRHAFEAAGLKPVADLPDDVSRVRRGNIVIYTNVREEPQTFKTTDTGTALLGPAPANGELTLPAYGVAVLRLNVERGPVTAATTQVSGPIFITRSPARQTILDERKEPYGDVLCYGLMNILQVAPTKAVALLNRNIYTSHWNWDVEDGTDCVVFDSLDALGKAKTVSLVKGGPAPDVLRGNKVRWHNRYPMSGGFVPLGAKLNGRPHPAAGTGFLTECVETFPLTKDGFFDRRTTSAAELQVGHKFYAVTFDGKDFKATCVGTYAKDSPLAIGSTPWTFAASGLTDAIPDGEDFIQPSRRATRRTAPSPAA